MHLGVIEGPASIKYQQPLDIEAAWCRIIVYRSEALLLNHYIFQSVNICPDSLYHLVSIGLNAFQLKETELVLRGWQTLLLGGLFVGGDDLLQSLENILTS